jgi:hypothetical protein
MFGANITEYDNKKNNNISHSNSLKNKINIIESVLNNIINTNFDSNMNNIFNVYELKLKELHEKINESIKNIEIVKKNKSIVLQMSTQYSTHTLNNHRQKFHSMDCK